jgi:glycosyltransferase involved in cell wall biosynthesis
MIWGFMRVRNEQRWIGRVLQSMVPACERIVMLDDHSTDETVAIARSFKEVTLYESEFEGTREDRDKNFLLGKLESMANVGDWVVSIDGDEEIADGGPSLIRSLTRRHAGVDCYKFQVLYLWDNDKQVRTDGIYRDFYRPSLFKLQPGARFQSQAGCGFHCGNVPSPNHIERSNVRLLHYGYMLKDDRIRKFNWYTSPDKEPIPPIEDGYKHMVVGDLFPATSQFRHAGPLELRAL